LLVKLKEKYMDDETREEIIFLQVVAHHGHPLPLFHSHVRLQQQTPTMGHAQQIQNLTARAHGTYQELLFHHLIGAHKGCAMPYL
jgi:hypothetical protein